MPNELSVVSSTALSSGAQKLGQPVPLSNFGLRREQRQVAAGAGEGAVAMLLQQRAGERPFGAFLAQHVVLRRRQKLVPFRVSVGDFVDRSRPSRPAGRARRPRAKTAIPAALAYKAWRRVSMCRPS